MSVIVVATITPKAGRLPDVLAAFALVSPKVHDEGGCELYAAHRNADHVVIVERWNTPADLAAHAAGTPMAQLNALLRDALEVPTDVAVLEDVPLGDPVKGTIQ